MLISMTVENFKSIKNRHTIMFKASNIKNHLQENIHKCDVSNIEYLKSIGLYGANASGKSNILLAFQALRYLIVQSGSLKDGELLKCYEPYKLDKTTLNSPSYFEIDFLNTDGIRHTYKVTFTSSKIISESLDFYPNKVKSNIFNREQEDTWETISFGAKYKGGLKKISFFNNNSYLSKIGNNAASPYMIRNIYNLFLKDIYHLGTTQSFKLNSSTTSNLNDVIKNIANIIRLVDTGIQDIKVKQVEIELPEELEKMNLPTDLKKQIIEDNRDQFIFTHLAEGGLEVEFELSEESEGTKKLFTMLHPIIEAFKHRKIFIFDELDNGLHPHIAAFIIKLFNDKTINKVGSQILFSTHNILLMSPEKMRRDQIYFVEKQEGQSSIYSLNDFDKTKVKPSTPYHHWYDDGRFGGIPIINFTKIKSLIIDINNPDKVSIDTSVFGKEL